MWPSEIDDVKKIFFLRKWVGQYTCQVLSSKYYSFRNYDGGRNLPPPPVQSSLQKPGINRVKRLKDPQIRKRNMNEDKKEIIKKKRKLITD